MSLPKGSNQNSEESSVPPRNVPRRRNTRSRSRASPGRGPLHNGLMNAAWPRSPKYPHVKPSSKPYSSLNQAWVEKDNISRLTDQVEEMEVDSHDNPILLSSGAVTELSLLRHKVTGFQKEKPTNNQPEIGATSFPTIELDESKDTKTKVDGVKEIKKSPVDSRSEPRNEPGTSREIEADDVKQRPAEEKPVSSSSLSPIKKTKSAPIFLVLHASRVDLGKISGPATCPVKIYGERIMIQMEDKITSKEFSWRIICQHITELKINFKSRPFYLKMKVSKIQNVTKQKSAIKNTDLSKESVAFYLAYENKVPKDIRCGIKQLFKEKLADLNLWQKSDSDEESLEPASKKASATDTNRTIVDGNIQENSPMTSQGARKRTPSEKTNHQTGDQDILRDTKITRRSLSFERTDERVKSLEHEAARYQLLLGQKRLEIQSLEQQLSDREAEIIIAREEALRAIEAKDNDINELQNSLRQLRILNDSEKDKNNTNEQRIANMQKALDEHSKVAEQHEQAILVRDNQLKKVRSTSTAGSPQKLTDSEYADEIKRMGNRLQQARTNLDEARRTKRYISEELRKTVDTISGLREQLRVQISRNRKLEIEKSADTRRLNDMESSKRFVEIALNEERLRTSSLERELFNSRRRAENEENLRHELESDCQSLRTQVEQKNAVIEHVTSERDSAVADARILKQELNQINQQQPSSVASSSNAVEKSIDDTSPRGPNDEVDDWVIDRTEIILQDVVLGIGGWGNVKLGNFRGTEVAVKQIHHLILSSHNRRLFSREMRIASRCRHPCLLQFIGATCDDGAPLFVSEVLDTDLRTQLGLRSLTSKETVSVALDIVLALNYLHKATPIPIIHRDISSSNVLLWYKGSDLHAKLSDYGAANFLRISMTRYPGAALYSAPETASRHQTTKVDIFSFGILLCEMFIRELPVIQQRAQQVSLVRNEQHRSLVSRCIEEDPHLRPSADELVVICRDWNRQLAA